MRQATHYSWDAGEGSRGPMQWTADRLTAGFTDAAEAGPTIRLSPSLQHINVKVTLSVMDKYVPR